MKVEDDMEVNTNESEDTHGDVKAEDDMKVNTDETCTAVDEIKGKPNDRIVSCESKEGNTNNIMASDNESGADEAHPDGVGAHGAAEEVPCEDDTACADAEMPTVDSSTSCPENKTVCEDKPSEAKRPLPDSTTEVENIQVSDDKCLQEGAPEGKQGRRSKRRKVVESGTPEKRRTRSSSRTPSLD